MQLEKGNKWKASLLWALGIFLKVFPLIVFCYLIFKKDWKTSGYLIISCLFLLLVCVGFQGIELWTYYFLTILPESFNGQITTPFVVSYQSFYMFLKFLLVKDKFLNPFPMWDNVPLFVYLNYLLKAFLAFSTYLVLSKRSDIFGFGVLFLTVILMLPYGSSYGNILLVFIYLNVLIDRKIGQMVWVSGILFLISNLGIWYFESLPSIFRFPRLFLLGVLYLVLIVKYWPTLDWCWVLIFIFPLIPWYIQLQKPPIRETELISTDDRPLLLDISLKKGYLNYDYWGHQGLKSVQTSINGKPGDAKRISIRNNQIYYGQRQLTFSNGHKKSPLVMDSTVVFLSDLDKGMGFYSIWSVPIN
ncbi:MAG: glycosyltransferase 87 family protein [Cytophagales bacterium]|nr:glycosyltransferase 87 family protein [Cytophagales bacterium]